MDEKGIRVPPVIKIVSSFSLIKGVGIHINLGNSDKIYYIITEIQNNDLILYIIIMSNLLNPISAGESY